MEWIFTLLDIVHSPKGLGGQRGNITEGVSILGVSLKLPNI